MPRGIYEGNKGKKLSDETKLKMKSRIPWNKGIKLGFTPKKSFKKGNIPWNKGLKGLQVWHNIEGLKLSTNKGRKFGPHTTKTKIKMSEAHMGEKSHLWRGGITPENHKIRRSMSYRDWRNLVFTRDNFTCRRCLLKNGKGLKVVLNAHHIKNFSDNKKLRLNVDNGVTLCNNCHKQFHEEYGLKNNTLKQLNKFIKNYDR